MNFESLITKLKLKTWWKIWYQDHENLFRNNKVMAVWSFLRKCSSAWTLYFWKGYLFTATSAISADRRKLPTIGGNGHFIVYTLQTNWFNLWIFLSLLSMYFGLRNPFLKWFLLFSPSLVWKNSIKNLKWEVSLKWMPDY